MGITFAGRYPTSGTVTVPNDGNFYTIFEMTSPYDNEEDNYGVYDIIMHFNTTLPGAYKYQVLSGMRFYWSEDNETWYEDVLEITSRDDDRIIAAMVDDDVVKLRLHIPPGYFKITAQLADVQPNASTEIYVTYRKADVQYNGPMLNEIYLHSAASNGGKASFRRVNVRDTAGGSGTQRYIDIPYYCDKVTIVHTDTNEDLYYKIMSFRRAWGDADYDWGSLAVSGDGDVGALIASFGSIIELTDVAGQRLYLKWPDGTGTTGNVGIIMHNVYENVGAFEGTV